MMSLVPSVVVVQPGLPRERGHSSIYLWSIHLRMSVNKVASMSMHIEVKVKDKEMLYCSVGLEV